MVTRARMPGGMSGSEATGCYQGLPSKEQRAENRVGGRRDGSRSTAEGSVFQGAGCWLWQDAGGGMIAAPRGHLDRLDVETGDAESKIIGHQNLGPERSRMMKAWLPSDEQNSEFSIGHLSCWVSEGHALEVTGSAPLLSSPPPHKREIGSQRVFFQCLKCPFYPHVAGLLSLPPVPTHRSRHSDPRMTYHLHLQIPRPPWASHVPGALPTWTHYTLITTLRVGDISPILWIRKPKLP